ncbi:hypothetical protein LOTGIDRAFT_175435 [Lottia gigantea]|uniref:Uncharacterized protein n=1 Tax=Lottia gigantea TaxID=225164 RepID=V4ALF7_LOTGI|nr:hypothetical protein LOTGIDRAFT_175435 [Lottia gigantea]ESO94416.1 hypothetical protein LOTGIDRAFT_175435 [Lottia gigantea]
MKIGKRKKSCERPDCQSINLFSFYVFASEKAVTKLQLDNMDITRRHLSFTNEQETSTEPFDDDTVIMYNRMRFAINITTWTEKTPALYHGHLAFLDFTRLSKRVKYE